MRTVVNSHEVYHLWAAQAQDRARTPNGNVSFEGNYAYSYRAVIGRIVTNVRGEKAFLVNTDTWSVTTSGNQSMLRRAIPKSVTTFYTDSNLGNSYQGMLQVMLQPIGEMAAKAERARQNKPYLLAALENHICNLKAFAEFFDLPVPDTLDGDDLAEQVRVAQEQFKAENKIKLDKEKAWKKERQQTALERLADWLHGDGWAYGIRDLEYQYMRVVGDTVQTTMGAVVPLEHVQKQAPIILWLIDTALTTGKPYIPSHDVRLGHYKLEKITPKGEVVVGCHLFEESEIRRFAALIATHNIVQETEDATI